MPWSYSTYHSSLLCSSARPNARAPRFRPHASSPPGSLSSSFGAALAHTLRGIELHACLAHVRGHGLDGRASGESTPCRPERHPRPLMITDDAEALQRDRLAEGAWTVRPVGCPRGPSPRTTHSAHPPLRWRTDAAGLASAASRTFRRGEAAEASALLSTADRYCVLTAHVAPLWFRAVAIGRRLWVGPIGRIVGSIAAVLPYRLGPLQYSVPQRHSACACVPSSARFFKIACFLAGYIALSLLILFLCRRMKVSR
jgi:hypothetical protein